MNNELAVLPAGPAEVTEAQSAAWVSLAKAKNEMTYALQKAELSAQHILITVQGSADYKIIDSALVSYRKAQTDMCDLRKTFTNVIDSNIVQPLMTFEKRVKENPLYTTLTDKSLSLRKTESDNAAKLNQKNLEITRFKTHVENEFFRVAAEYRQLLRKESLGQYEIALRENLNGGTGDLKKMMATLDIPEVKKFSGTLLSGDEMMTIYENIPKPDYMGIYNEMMAELDKMFANLDSDIANKDAALKHQKEQSKLAEIEETKKLQENTALNTLIASSETVVVDTPKIKRTLSVQVVESESWAKAVMAAFIVNLPHMAKYIRVKSWIKLTIGQMAEYLSKLASETGTAFNNLELKEVEK